MRSWCTILIHSTFLVRAWISPQISRARQNRPPNRPSSVPRFSGATDFVWERQENNEWVTISLSNNTVALETWRWCSDFVVPLDLCPWAAASVKTPGALRIFIVPGRNDEVQDAIMEATERLRHDVETRSIDPNVVIALIVSSERDWDFESFYEWFEDVEETFEDDSVTLAPFHPDWEFGGGPLELDIEKQSPYPTVTVVCTSVIDKAGSAATKQIGTHNEAVLLDLGVSKLRQIYDNAVFHKESPS